MLGSWANLLTFLRLILAPFIVWLILKGNWNIASAAIFIAIVSDILDGKIARKLNQTSTFGGLFDHATDALLVSSAAWALNQIGMINGLLWALILLAFAQYVLDSESLGGKRLRSSRLGKLNGIAYFALVTCCIGFNALNLTELNIAGLVAAWILVATTLFSIGDRLASLLRVKKRIDT
jgi:CDP-diacylglycerol--glycerol-3-phosphate 3-phosphatidyltransferase